MLQVLTSETTGTGADLLCWLRSRWRIENMFKDAAEHNGIDALADYGMDIGTDTRKVTNPARSAARKTVKTAETGLADAERSLAQLLASGGTPKQMNAALPGIHRRIEKATQDLADAKKALKPIRAKIPANELNPDAQLARPHLKRRSMQMVLRLLAFNTAPSPPTSSTKAAPSITPPRPSPSPSRGQTAPAPPAPFNYSPRNSTTHPPSSPATTEPSPTKSPGPQSQQ